MSIDYNTTQNMAKKGIEQKMELFYKKNTIYSITINPDDKHQYYGSLNRLEKVRGFVYEQLLCLRGYHIDYSIYMELSEPKSNAYNKVTKRQQSPSGPRYHYHGIIGFRSTLSVRRFLDTVMYNLSRWCIYDIDSIGDASIWKKYCKKQQHIIKQPPLTNLVDDVSLWRSPVKGESDKDKTDLLET